jgi:hypothetical protein
MKTGFLTIIVAAACVFAAQQTVPFAGKRTMGNSATITVANKKHHNKKHMKRIASATMAPAAQAGPVV